jgi:DNA repair protein RAD50
MLEKLQMANKMLKDLDMLKQTAILLARSSSNIEELTQEISQLEQELSKTGSTKTAGQLKDELDDLSTKM